MTRVYDFPRPELASATETAIADVTVLATTDLHAHLFPFNYYTDQRDDTVGLAGIAARIGDLAVIPENCLLVDNGDTLQGAPLGDVAVSRGDGAKPHPMIAAMNAMNYDAATLGNHDFDFGLGVVRQAVADARFPVVLANARLADGRGFLPGHVVLRRTVTDRAGRQHPFRVGIIGVAPPQIAQWHGAILKDALIWEDMVTATRREIARIRDDVDLLVVLAHSGVGGERPGDGAENAAGAIAGLDGVDAVVAGHTHRVIAEPGGRMRAALIQPGYWGSHLGHIRLTVARPVADPGGRWTVQDSVADVHPIRDTRAGATAALRRSLRRLPALRAQLLQDHRETRRQSGRVLGRSAARLTTYFAMLGRSRAMDVVAEAKRAEVARRLAGTPHLQDLPILAAVAPFKAGGRGGPGHFTDIPAGALRLRHAADLYVFPNFLAVLKVTGAGLRAWLETSASIFRTIARTPGGDGPQRLLEEGYSSYYFDVLYGLSYKIDLSRAGSGGRVQDVTLADGRPLADADEVLVATNNFRASGGGGFAAAAWSETVLETSDPVRDCVAAYLKSARGPIAPAPRTVWRFVPLGGVPVSFCTGPGAVTDTEGQSALGLTDLGLRPSGFHRFGFRM